MERSREIKIGNERSGLLCTKTCKNAPHWVPEEEKINHQPWCIHLKWADELSTLSGSSRASHLMNQGFSWRQHWFADRQGCSVSAHGKGRQPGSHQNSAVRGQGNAWQGATRRAGFPPRPLFGKWGVDLSQPQGLPSHLSILEFPNRRGQSRVLMDWCAIFLVHYFNITFGNRKP